jgi:WD40 repeat protein
MFDPQNPWVYLADGDVLTVYDFDQRRIVTTLEGIQPLDFYQNLFAYEYADGVRIIDTETWEQIYDLSYVGRWPEETTSEDDYTQVSSVAYAQFRPDGSGLIVKWESMYSATWEGRFNSAYDLWTLADTTVQEVEERYRFVPSYPSWVSVLPDGQLFAIEDDLTVLTQGRVDSLATGRILSQWDRTTVINFAFQGEIAALPFQTPENDQFSTGIWNVQTGEQLGVLPTTGATALSPTGDQIVIDSTVYDVASGEVIARLQNDTYQLLPGTNRILWLKSDNTLHLLDTADLTDIATLDLPRSEMYASQYPQDSYRVLPETILIRTQDTTRWLQVDLDTGETLMVFEDPQGFKAFAQYSLDAHYLVTESKVGNFNLWAVASGQPVTLPEFHHIQAPFMTPNGLLVLRSDSEIVFYDLSSSTAVMSFAMGDAATIPELLFNQTYLSIKTSDHVTIWDWQNNTQVVSLTDVGELRFGPDNHLLAYVNENLNYAAVVSLPAGDVVWDMTVDDRMIEAIQFDTNTQVRVYFLWDDIPACHDIITNESDCATAHPTPPFLQTEDLGFSLYGQILNAAGEEIIRLALPRGAVRLALSPDQTRLLVEYNDGTLGVWEP